ncbi:MAG: hypothetical protein ABIH67_01305 [Candidatus Uhrbacteria bacterium]
MNKKLKITLSLFAFPVAVIMFVYAGVDDSPGGQLIGVVVGAAGIAGLLMSLRK